MRTDEERQSILLIETNPEDVRGIYLAFAMRNAAGGMLFGESDYEP